MMRVVEEGDDALWGGGENLTGMGMGIEVAANRLKISPTSNQNGAPVIPEPTYNWATSGIAVPRETSLGLRRPFPESMDRSPVEDFSKDSIRNTMLKHEKIFKEQVYELHRLYQVQQRLTSELSRQLRLHPMTATTANDISGAKSIFCGRHSPPFRDTTPVSISQLKNKYALHPDSGGEKAETSSRGLSIDTREALRLQRGLNLELGGKESPVRSFSPIDNRPPCLESLPPCESEESDLELTLSIGSGSSRQRTGPRPFANPELRPSLLNSLKARQQHSSHSGMQEEGSGGGHDANLAGKGVQQPAWLFQNLSLSRR